MADRRTYPTGWRQAPDDKAQRLFPLSALPLAAAPVTLEGALTPPNAEAYKRHYDQTKRLGTYNGTNSCVGQGVSGALSFQNSPSSKQLRRYDPYALWERAKALDPWTDTNPGDNNGTSVRTGLEVVRTEGHARQTAAGVTKPWSLAERIREYRWCATADEVRSALAATLTLPTGGAPVILGSPWWEAMTRAERRADGWWLPERPTGAIAGGHCYLLTGGSDRLQAFRVRNSWFGWPGSPDEPVWLPYRFVEERLRIGDMEAAVIVDYLPGAGR